MYNHLGLLSNELKNINELKQSAPNRFLILAVAVVTLFYASISYKTYIAKTDRLYSG